VPTPLSPQWFFSDSTGVEQFVEEFAKKNKDVFDLEAEEHKLEYTAVYKDFQDQFEKKIEVRLQRCVAPRGRALRWRALRPVSLAELTDQAH
jgi:hypothetical protein